MRTMGKSTAAILPLLLFVLLAFIETSPSTATAVRASSASSGLRRVYQAASSIKTREDGRKLQTYAVPADSDAETCIPGVEGILHDNHICCHSSCGKCTGKGCFKSYTGPTDEFNGGQSCCESGIKSTNRVCSADVGAPCVVVPDAGFCMAGVPGILYKNKVCCHSACGICADDGCSKSYGGPTDEFNGEQSCCKSGIQSTNRVCSATVGAPCVLSSGPAPTPVTYDDLVCASDRTTVTVYQASETGYDARTAADNGCDPNGCLPELAHDGDSENDESRWSCTKELAGGQCEITFTFEDPQDLRGMDVFFYKGDERKRTLKVKVNGQKVGEFDSTPGAIMSSYKIEEDGVNSVTLESIGIGSSDWISIIEVKFWVV